MNYLLSVIVPAHNEERTICKTVDSLLRQDYSCFEIIVVDDQYVKELVGKLSEKIKTDEYFLRELFNGVSSYITSDCTVNQIIRLSEGWEELTDWELKTIDGEAIVGDEFMEFYPNEEALKELVLDSFYVPLDE